MSHTHTKKNYTTKSSRLINIMAFYNALDNVKMTDAILFPGRVIQLFLTLKLLETLSLFV